MRKFTSVEIVFAYTCVIRAMLREIARLNGDGGELIVERLLEEAIADAGDGVFLGRALDRPGIVKLIRSLHPGRVEPPQKQ